MKKKVILILITMLLSVLIIGCADDNETTTDGVDNSAEEADNSTESKYSLGANEELLFEDDNYYYIEQTDEIENEDNIGDAPNETLSYIYKMNIDGSNKKMILKEPVRDWFINYEISTDNWLYLSIIEWVPYSESYPLGIARIDRNNDKFEMVASPSAYGLVAKDDTGYFFWHKYLLDNGKESNAGIYQLNLETGEYKRLGPLPNMDASAAYEGGSIKEIKEGKIYFSWFGEEYTGDFVLDIESGTIEKTT